MRKTMFAVLSTLALIAGPAFAQQTTTPQAGQPQAGQLDTERQVAPPRGQRQAGQRQAGQQRGERGPAMRSSDLTGLNVRNPQNEDLGSVNDLVIDLETGQVRYVAMSVGGILGVGDDLFAIPWAAFRMQITDDDTHLVLNATEQQFENAPGFDKDNWPNMADPQWRTTNDSFYVERGISTAPRGRGAAGLRQDGVRQDGVRQDGVRQDGVRRGTGRQDAVRPGTGRQDGVRQDDVRPGTGRQDAVQPGTGRQDGARLDTDPQQPRTGDAGAGTQPAADPQRDN